MEHLAQSGLSASEALHIYLRGKLENKFDLDAMFAQSLEIERSKEHGAAVCTTDFIESAWREEQLFTTINHPGPRLLVHVANSILRLLDFPPLPQETIHSCPLCDDDFEQPIHPAIGRHFGLPFATWDRTYDVFGKKMTFARYAACYLDCLYGNEDNFIGYLHTVNV
jgi:hypothetical protein